MRDPRVDPREGDVVDARRTRRVVLDETVTLFVRRSDRKHADVTYWKWRFSLGIFSRTCSASAWRKWAKGGKAYPRPDRAS